MHPTPKAPLRASDRIHLRSFGQGIALGPTIMIFGDVLDELRLQTTYRREPCVTLLLGGHHHHDGLEFIEIQGFEAARYMDHTREALEHFRREHPRTREHLDAGQRILGWSHGVSGCQGRISADAALVHLSFFNLPFQTCLMIDPDTEQLGFFRQDAEGRLHNVGFTLIEAVEPKAPESETSESVASEVETPEHETSEPDVSEPEPSLADTSAPGAPQPEAPKAPEPHLAEPAPDAEAPDTEATTRQEDISRPEPDPSILDLASESLPDFGELDLSDAGLALDGSDEGWFEPGAALPSASEVEVEVAPNAETPMAVSGGRGVVSEAPLDEDLAPQPSFEDSVARLRARLGRLKEAQSSTELPTRSTPGGSTPDEPGPKGEES